MSQAKKMRNVVKKVLACNVVLFNKRRGREVVISTRKDMKFVMQFRRGVTHDIGEFQVRLSSGQLKNISAETL